MLFPLDPLRTFILLDLISNNTVTAMPIMEIGISIVGSRRKLCQIPPISHVAEQVHGFKFGVLLIVTIRYNSW